jgi:hypothetical protein
MATASSPTQEDDDSWSELGFCVFESSGAFGDVLATGATDGPLGEIGRVPQSTPSGSTSVAHNSN